MQTNYLDDVSGESFCINLEIEGNLVQQKRHPSQKLDQSARIDFPKLHKDVLSSWSFAFRYKQAIEEYQVQGLRAPQIGAIHAIQAHFITSDEPATIVLPTGAGKTEVMLSTMIERRCSRILVVVPTEPLRTQISEKFRTLGILKNIGVVSSDALYPVVCTLEHIPKSKKAANKIFKSSQVIVATANLLSQCSDEIKRAIVKHCPYLFVDEAHHREANSWTELIQYFSYRRILQFTATPYRNDGKPITGKIIFNYPLRQAQRDGYFTNINFTPVQVFHPDVEVADREIASKSVAKLREDLGNGLEHLLMARVNTISRAEEVFKIYSEYSDLNPVCIHTKLSASERREIREQIMQKKAKIIVCVDMLGEGFDLPELKIAAFHDIRKSLPVTLQLVGRFTRAKQGLGEATIFANVADPPTKSELQELYQQDPNWNHLLRMTSEKMIQSEIDLREFVDGFDEISTEIPLQNVRIKMSTAVYKTTCENWRPDNFEAGINKASYDWIKHDINHERDTLIILKVKKIPLLWLQKDEFHSLEMELLVVFWDRDQQLLFINQSSNKGYAENLAKAVTASDTSLIKGMPVFRSLANINRLRLRNVGLREEQGRLIRYIMRAGSDVEPAITSAQKRKASRSNIFGAGFENGEEVTIGCTIKGRIWSAKECNIDEFVKWCRLVGSKIIDETIDAEKILEGALVPEHIISRPPLVPIAIDWHKDVYLKSASSFQVSFSTSKTSLHHVELKMCNILDLTSELVFSLNHGDNEVKYRLLFDDDPTKGGYFEVINENDVSFQNRRRDPISGKSFFTEYPPTLFFEDGSTLTGNEFIDLSFDVSPYDTKKIVFWDWSGVDITVESQGVEKRANSIQYRVIQELKKEDYDIIFDDDDSGEAADVLAIRDHEIYIEIELFHCKYSQETFAGRRIADLYEVCGQAQKSVRWKAQSTSLFEHLLRREQRVRGEESYSRLEKGNQTDLISLRNKSRQMPVEFKICIVQPGLASNPSTSQLELLSVTENHLMATYQVPFAVIGNKISSK